MSLLQRLSNRGKEVLVGQQGAANRDRRGGSGATRNRGANHAQPHGSQGGGASRATSSTGASGNGGDGSLGPASASSSRAKEVVDPETCLEVFKSHWLQAVTVMNRTNMSSAGARRTGLLEDIEAVCRYIEQMINLLIEEQPPDKGRGPIFSYMLSEDILDKILTWSSRCGEHQDRLRLRHLKMFDRMISLSPQQLLCHKPVIRPLLNLLSQSAEHPNKEFENCAIHLLHHLCVALTQHTEMLEVECPTNC